MAQSRCSVPLCDGPHVARGFCHRHYREFLRKGGKRLAAPERIYGLTDEERFWHYVQTGPHCWEWTGYRNAKGYGVINLGGERELAHRFAWKLRAEIPKGMSVLHHCDNAACVKFKHLFLGTRADNNADMLAKGRYGHADAKGGKNNQARLAEADIRAIRASPEPATVLAKRYGVSRGHIHAIIRRQFWPHIE